MPSYLRQESSATSLFVLLLCGRSIDVADSTRYMRYMIMMPRVELSVLILGENLLSTNKVSP
jgi:hypothetical protein